MERKAAWFSVPASVEMALSGRPRLGPRKVDTTLEFGNKTRNHTAHSGSEFLSVPPVRIPASRTFPAVILEDLNSPIKSYYLIFQVRNRFLAGRRYTEAGTQETNFKHGVPFPSQFCKALGST